MDTTPDPTSPEAQIRLLVQQTALPKYRVPTFRRLAAVPGISLRVLWGKRRDIPHVGADGFLAESSEIIRVPFGFYWQRKQVSGVCLESVDVVSMPWSSRSLSTLAGAIAARILGKGVVMWGHGYSKHERALAMLIRHALSRLAHAVVVYNRGTRERLIEQGMSPDRVFVALNSLYQVPIQKAREEVLADVAGFAEFRSSRGLEGADQGVPVILFVSRLDRDNRVDLLLSAAAGLRDRFGCVRVVIVGGGSEFERLKTLAEELTLGSDVVFTGPLYEEPELARYFLAADVFCYPENIGLSILHAFGYGLPVVTSDNIESQNPEIEALRHGVNGLLYQHGSVDALRDALASLLQDAETRRRMGEAARKTVMDEFTTEVMVDGLRRAAEYAFRHSRRGRRLKHYSDKSSE